LQRAREIRIAGEKVEMLSNARREGSIGFLSAFLLLGIHFASGRIT
jgi:hypothetical protein